MMRQEFILPRAHVLEFIGELERRLQAARLTPTVVDVEAVQADDFLLSANRGLCGDLVGVMFEGLREAQRRRAQDLMRGLAECCAELGGRVSMIKNVHVAPETLREMYGDGLAEFLRLKQRLDPQGYVLVQGELWKAQPVSPSDPLEPGARVRIASAEGMLLLVEKES